MQLGDLVEIWLVIRVSRLFLINSRTLHVLTQVRQSSEKEFMVIPIPVGPLRDATETPSIGLADKRRKLGVLEKLKKGSVSRAGKQRQV